MAKAVNQSQVQPTGQSMVYKHTDPLNGVQTRTMSGNQSKDPYRSGLQTSFQGVYDPGSRNSFNTFANDTDADVRQAQELTNIKSAGVSGRNQGVDQVATQAQLDAVLARIGQKNAIGEAIASSDTQEHNAENDLRYTANEALSSGIKNTRENFNGRGLLYSGMRQGGESKVRSGVAGNLAAGLANTKRDYGNQKDANKMAYAAVGHAQEAMKLDAANQAFDTVTRNNIARMQAYQQLGEGIGGVAGAVYGGRGNTTQTPSSGGNGGYSSSMNQDGMRNHSYISPD